MLTCVETYAKSHFYSCLVGVNFINPYLYFVNASLDTEDHEEKYGGHVGESFLNPSFTPFMTHMQNQKQTQLTRELFELIMNEVGKCDTECFDSVLKVGKSDVYVECMDKCIVEISRKFGIPYEKLIEVLVNDIGGDGKDG